MINQERFLPATSLDSRLRGKDDARSDEPLDFAIVLQGTRAPLFPACIIETMDKPGIGFAPNAWGDSPGGTVRVGRVCEPCWKGRSGEPPPNLALHATGMSGRPSFGNIVILERLVTAAPATRSPRLGW